MLDVGSSGATATLRNFAETFEIFDSIAPVVVSRRLGVSGPSAGATVSLYSDASPLELNGEAYVFSNVDVTYTDSASGASATALYQGLEPRSPPY